MNNCLHGLFNMILILFKINSILGSEVMGNLNIKRRTFDFEERVLIGWLANTVREPTSQDAYIKIQHFCFHVKGVYHFRIPTRV